MKRRISLKSLLILIGVCGVLFDFQFDQTALGHFEVQNAAASWLRNPGFGPRHRIVR